MKAQSIKLSIWEQNKPPYEVDAKFENKDCIELLYHEVHGSALVFCHLNTRSYNLGEYFFNSRLGKKISLSNSEELALGKVGKKIEASALSRFKGLLQKSNSLDLEIKINNSSFEAKIVPLTEGSTSSFFICESKNLKLEAGMDITIAAFLGGIAYMFHSHVMDVQGEQLALALPSSATRIIRRVVPRSAGDFGCKVYDSNQNVLIQNYSAFGMCLKVENENEFEINQEIKIQIRNSKNVSCDTYALIRDINNQRLHIVFAGSTENMKKRFLMLGFEQFRPFEFLEVPEKSWECLARYNYLTLLEPGVLELVKQKCIDSWGQLKNTDFSFQPVAFNNDDPIGTIGVVKMTDELWLPHTLATKVDPSVIDVTAGLYSSWPNYLISLSQAMWMVTWYDANKAWHNRFFQVFIKEHERDYNLVSFIRQQYHLPRIHSYAQNKYIFSKENDEDKSILQSEWKTMWATCLNSPIMRLENKSSEVSTFSFGSIMVNTNIVGGFKLIQSPYVVNPIGHLQAIYISIFDQKIKSSQVELKEIMESCHNFLKENNFTRACVMLDYDALLAKPQEVGFHYIYELRCLTAASKLMPSMIANNEISFADMKLRKVSA